MGDSSSFSSLFALVDSHLSKSNIQQDSSQPSTSGLGSIRLPPFNVQRGLSDTGLASTSFRFPNPRLSLTQHPVNDVLSKRLHNMNPFTSKEVTQDDENSLDTATMCMSDCPINDVLAIQLSNMFKAREAKEEEEKRKQEEMERQKLEQSSCLIDLMPAVQLPGQARPEDVEILSSSSSLESVVIPDPPDVVENEEKEPERPLATIPGLDLTPELIKSLKPFTDVSHVLKYKRGKCSPFGKVLCARYKPVAAPYVRTYVPHNIKVFDFSTPSPDDINLERMRKPSYYSNSYSSSALTMFE